jgi:NTE family protein
MCARQDALLRQPRDRDYGPACHGVGRAAARFSIRIDGELYWDGGILFNTPTEAIFEDNPRRNSLIFAVHMWNPMGPEPETIWEVLHRHKDIQYSSRVASHIAQQRQVHKLRHVISELVELIPEDARKDPLVKDLADYGCLTRMHVVQLLAPRLDNENHTKDIDFSPTGIRLRWEAGYADTIRALRRSPWDEPARRRHSARAAARCCGCH